MPHLTKKISCTDSEYLFLSSSMWSTGKTTKTCRQCLSSERKISLLPSAGGLMQSSKISVHVKGRVSTCFLWLIKESIWKFLEKVQALVLTVSPCMLTKPYSHHCFTLKKGVGVRVAGRRVGWGWTRWDGRTECKPSSACFRAENISSHALFSYLPNAQSEGSAKVACHHHPCYIYLYLLDFTSTSHLLIRSFLIIYIPSRDP